MSLFTFLESISPWWWLAFGLLLAAAEMVVFSFFLMWPALAAIIMAVILAILPPIGGELQVSMFAILSIVLTFAGRHFFQRNDEPETGLNQRTKQIIGKAADVESFELGSGHITINGLTWSAEWRVGQTAKKGDKVRIVSAEGMTVLVENI